MGYLLHCKQTWIQSGWTEKWRRYSPYAWLYGVWFEQPHMWEAVILWLLTWAFHVHHTFPICAPDIVALLHHETHFSTLCEYIFPFQWLVFAYADIHSWPNRQDQISLYYLYWDGERIASQKWRRVKCFYLSGPVILSIPYLKQCEMKSCIPQFAYKNLLWRWYACGLVLNICILRIPFTLE